MSTFVWVPTYGTSGTRENRRIGGGVCPRVWSVTFENRPAATASAIEAFLQARAGVASFAWTPPVGGAGVWSCERWTLTPTAPGFVSVSAEFYELAD